MNTDANSVAGAGVTVTSPPIDVVASTTYTLSILIQTQYGVNGPPGPGGTRNTNFSASVFRSATGGMVSTPTYSTQSGNGGTVVTPINGGWSTGQTVTLTFTSSITGTVQARYAFAMAGTTGGNNDDYQITSNFTVCTR